MTKIDRPSDQPRVESGALQFGDDWPGLFLRGDDAICTAFQITEVLDALPDAVPGTTLIAVKWLESLKKWILDDVALKAKKENERA
jgi:hypothetical protein